MARPSLDPRLHHASATARARAASPRRDLRARCRREPVNSLLTCLGVERVRGVVQNEWSQLHNRHQIGEVHSFNRAQNNIMKFH
jgi:hypothetical protein